MSEQLIHIESGDNVRVSVESTIAFRCHAVKNRVLNNEVDENGYVVFNTVSGAALVRVLDYCRWEWREEDDNYVLGTLKRRPRRSRIGERRADGQPFFAEYLAQASPAVLCELASASYYLDVKPLVDLTCRAIADTIKGKSPEEIRSTFNIVNDFTPAEEEQVRRSVLERTIMFRGDEDGPPTYHQCRGRRGGKKKQAQTSLSSDNTDTRSVDELMNAIDAIQEPNSTGQKKKKKKKKKLPTEPLKKADESNLAFPDFDDAEEEDEEDEEVSRFRKLLEADHIEDAQKSPKQILDPSIMFNIAQFAREMKPMNNSASGVNQTVHKERRRKKKSKQRTKSAPESECKTPTNSIPLARSVSDSNVIKSSTLTQQNCSQPIRLPVVSGSEITTTTTGSSSSPYCTCCATHSMRIRALEFQLELMSRKFEPGDKPCVHVHLGQKAELISETSSKFHEERCEEIKLHSPEAKSLKLLE